MPSLEKIKSLLVNHQNRLIISVVFALIAFIGFGLGFLAANWSKKEPINISQVDLSDLFLEKTGDFKFIASKNGENYYPKDCALADKLKTENIIEFISKEEAENFGFKQSLKCQY